MEHHYVLQNRTRDPQASGQLDRLLAPQPTETRKLGHRLKFGKDDVSCTNSCSEIIENVKGIPPRCTEFPLNQERDSKGKQNEELVRYMSSLPSFLERGKNLHEKSFNVGVLDWRLLEKWQHSHNIGNGHSPSSSNTLSFSSTEESSSRSSIGHSCSSAHRKIQHPTLQSHLYGPAVEASSSGSESSEGNERIFRDIKAEPSDFSDLLLNVPRTLHSFDKSASHGFKDFKEKDADLQRNPGARRSRSLEELKGKMKIQNCESLKRHDNLQASADDVTDKSGTRNQEKVVLVEPKDGLDHDRRSSESQLFVSTEKKRWGLKEARRQSFSNVGSCETVHAGLSCGIPTSILPLGADARHSSVEKTGLDDARKNTFSAEQCISCSPSGGKKLPDKPIITPLKELKSSEGRNQRMNTIEATNLRNPSPTRRFSIGIGRIGRTPRSSIATTTQQSTATEIENKSKANAKGRSSPLRRLLDPFIKPKEVNTDHSAEASLCESTLRNRTGKSSERRGELPPSHSVKIRLDLKHCKKIDAEDPHCGSKDGSYTVQALLQVAEKNGLPLFTFAVDNKSDVLAATVRKQSCSEKEGHSFLFTFFFIQEMRKKNGGRVNKGIKERGDYVPNVVAQMKVTDDLTQRSSLGESILKEFVLFSMGSRQAEQQASDLQLNNELAAFVVKIPKKTTQSLKEPFQNVGGNSDCLKNEENWSNIPSENRLSMTVIFPGGNHGVPIKGEPSSLIRRWKTGGSCDCGGWDLGCQVRVLANHPRAGQGSSSIETRLSECRFELFPQGEEGDQKPVFSLSPFKDGIFSVEFNSSIKVLQAFAISLAFLGCFEPSKVSESRNLFRDKHSGNVTASEADETKVCSIPEAEFPVKYVSYPPVSPVGRV